MRSLPILLGVLILSTSLTAKPSPTTHRSLDGTWTNGTLTPLERPEQLAGKAYFTAEEAERFRRETIDRFTHSNPDPERGMQQTFDSAVAEATDMKVVDDLRTSLIVDPADGKVPPLLPAAQARRAARPQFSYDNVETIELAARCLAFLPLRGLPTAPPIVPTLMGSNYYQIVETPGAVLIFSELAHNARVVRIGGTHPPATIRQWLGDSVGHWEGQTLVVDTTNFRSDRSGERLHVVERFERIDDRTIRYQATVEDPDTWAAPWTLEVPFKATDQRIYEFACHEGNRAVENFMRGARDEERRAAEGRR